MIGSPKVVLFSQLNDVHAEKICSELSKLGAESYRIDAEKILDLQIKFSNDHFTLNCNGEEFLQNEITSVFLRRKPSSKDFGTEGVGLSANPDKYILLQKEALFQDAFFSFSLNSRLYNDFRAASAISGKAIQHQLARRLGFKVPATLVGGKNNAVANFIKNCWSQGKDACSKPLSPAYLVIDDELYTRYTEKVDRNLDLTTEDFESCPMIFQEYVDKDYELRITVCDEEAIAIRIDSQCASEGTEVDWRKYNIPKTPHFEHSIDDRLRAKLVEFNRVAGLRFSCFDIIVTPSGDYYFLETNQSGQWLWLEEITGAEITKMIAQQLARVY